MFKKRYLCLIVIICFFSIFTVSAEDNSTSNIISVSNDNSLEANILENNINSNVNDTTLKVSNSEILTAGNNWYVNSSKTSSGDGKSPESAFISLKEAINNASNDDMILIASGEYKGTDNTNLNIIKNLNFVKYDDGEVIIDAEGLRRIWYVTATSINITGLTFKNGKSTSNGGAIYFSKNTNSNINATFINNIAKSGGGAIYMYGDFSGNLEGSFINNTATTTNGGAILMYKGISGNLSGSFINNGAKGEGGAIYINSVGVSGNINGTFIKNTGTYGGAIRIKGGVTGNLGGSFINNTATYHSGAIRINGDVSGKLTGSFINNTGTYGAAIYIFGGLLGNLSGSFINNNASKDGGAIYITGGSGVSGNLTGSFINNIAGYAGAIYINGGNVLGNINGTFINNTAKYNGGAIHIYINGLSGNLTGSFINNTAQADGGAISINDGISGNLSGIFINNTAANVGGAIYINKNGVSGKLSGSFINNTAQADGGAIYIMDAGISGKLSGSFINNTAQADGGAIYIKDAGISGNLNASFINNTANVGGAIYSQRGINGNLAGSFINNTGTFGGAIYIHNGDFSGNLNGTFINNTATRSGGVINMNNALSGKLTGTFINNKAGNNGGAIYCGGGVSGKLTGTFINNSGNYGGAIYSYMGVYGNLTGSFINNRANYGGAIYVYRGINGNLCGSFINNTAQNDGSAICNDGSYDLCFIRDSIFINNNKNTICANSASINTINCWFGNNATNYTIKPSAGKNANMEDWLFLNATANPTELNVGETSTIIFKLESYNDTSKEIREYNASKMNVQLNIFQTLGKINQTTVLIGNEILYTAKQGGNASVTGKFESASYNINLQNNGSAPIPTNITVNTTSLDLTVSENSTIGATLNPSEAGNLTFTSNDTNIATVDNNGVVSAIAEGNAIIIVSFAGNEQYAPAENKTINVTVKLRDASVSVNNNTLDLNVDDTFDLIATTVPSGLNVTYTSNNESVVIVDASGKVTAKAEGSAVITVSVGGDGVYVLNSTDVAVSVSKVPTEINIANVTVALEVNDVIDSSASLTPADAGNLTYTSSNPNVVKVENGKIIALAEGNAIITVSFVGDDKYASAENKTINVTVKLRDASVSVNNNTLDLNVDDTFNLIATTVPSGLNVTYTSNNESVVIVDASGKVTAKAVGTAVITVSVGGDGVYVLNSTNVSGTVNEKPIPPKENLTISASAEAIIVGDDATVIVTGLKDATGEVTVTIGGDVWTGKISEGTANVVVTGLTETTIANVNFNGDDKYNPASTTVMITVNPKPKENLTISASAEAIIVGDDATVIVTGLKDATGEVTVTIGGNVWTGKISEGTANVVVTGLTETTSANVIYVGDDKYNPASTTVMITVNPKPKENLTIEATTEPITVGENATVIVTGLEDATGNVSVRAGNGVYFAPIVEGVATVIITGLKDTTIGIVKYGGDDRYNSASTTVKITVNPKPKENLTISALAQPIIVGDDATVIVTGLKDATGEVTVNVNAKTYTAPIKDSEATVTIPGLTESVTGNVNYPGDDKYNPASTTVKITVNPNVIIDAPDVTKYYGGAERFAVTLKDLNGNPIANADIKITINNRTYTKTTDKNGETSMGINLNSGVYDVTTEYNGTKVYSTVTVKDTVIAKDVTKIFRNGTQYQGTFVDSQGNLIRNTDVQININGVFYTRTTDANGMAQMNINLPPGTYILTAINPSTGEQHTTKVTVLPNIVENHDLTKYYRNASQYSLRLLDDKGNPVGAGVSIQLNINGVFYTRTSDANGYVKMNINLPPGTYIITAEYKGLRVSNTITVLTVLETEDLVMRYHDGSKFKAKVLDGQGRPYAGQTVTFNINGVFYTKTTDYDGVARLAINLLAGEYIITSTYNALNTANKVTIIG